MTELRPSATITPRENSVPAKLMRGLQQVILGREDTIALVVTALLADGHLLIEDLPGSGKTTLAKTLGVLISYESESDDSRAKFSPFRRIQFTPDMMPSDVIGVTVFEPKADTFRFVPGPIFSHLVLADELNRTSPKVQAAFLECMAEKQVTVDNTTYPLDELFFVVGTQNPLDLAGTYPLPGVQLDRFLFRIPMSYVDRNVELQLLASHEQTQKLVAQINPVVSREEVLAARAEVSNVYVAQAIQEAIVDLAQKTRNHPQITMGLSTRAVILFQRALKAWAFVNGRSHVEEDDFKHLAPFIVTHRLNIRGGSRSVPSLVDELVKETVEKLIRG